MDCTLARQLLDHGLEPTSRHPIRAKLGFHLASCPACRAYHADLQQRLLHELLHQPMPVRPAKPVPSKQRRKPRSRPILAAVAALMAIVLVALAARVAVAAYTIRQNVQSYIVPVATAAIVPQISPTIPPAVPTLVHSVPMLPPVEPTAASTPIPTGVVRVPTAQAIVPIVPTAIGAAPNEAIPTLAVLTATPAIPLSGSAPITILLLGSDRRPDEVGATRTDTLIVARVDPGLRRVALLSLPRDLIVEIPGYGYSRINAAYVYGELYPELGGGTALVRQTVSQLLDVPINYAVMVDFEGFIGLIDAIGGIDIEVPTALYDAEYPTMDYGYQVVAFDVGSQHMDGSRALQYARIRHMDSDFQRARRQQAIILAAAQQLRSQNPLQLLDSITAATTSLRGYITTDLPEDRMVALAWAFRDLAPANVERFVVDETMVQMNGEGGGCSSADDYYAQCISPQTLQPVIQSWLGQFR
jgi:polyisoprenyl-teichoic acid--peptidoglycan teichoic acid transferase